MPQPLANTSGIIYGDHNNLLPSHMNYGRYFLDEIVKYKSKIAMINGVTDEKMTYSEMAQQIVNTAAALSRLGVQRGAVVAICSENRLEFMVTTIAVLYAGAVVTLFNPAYSKDELVHAINISRPRYMFISPDVHQKHYNVLKQIRIIRRFIIFGDKTPYKMIATFKDLTRTSVDINSYRPADFYGKPETALILYSSGTTGSPKGVNLTHVNLIAASQKPLPYSDIPMLTTVPWCNCMGYVTTTDALTHGNTFIFLPKFQEKTYLENIERYRPGFLLVVPAVVVVFSKSTILHNYDVSSVEFMHCGGATLNPDTISQIQSRFPRLVRISQVYGMSETTGAITEELHNSHKQGSVGKIIPGNIIKIVDPESKKVLGPNQNGELCVKGLTLFDGYIRKPSELDNEGFYHAGDVAYYDDEGFFYIVDRLKELIKYNAWQVAPSELEALLLQHPTVKDTGVVGAPDAASGELPTAFIVKQQGANITEKEIIDFVASKVSPWKQLRGGVIFVKEIPKNGSGKILRRQLREMLKTPACKL